MKQLENATIVQPGEIMKQKLVEKFSNNTNFRVSFKHSLYRTFPVCYSMWLVVFVLRSSKISNYQ